MEIPRRIYMVGIGGIGMSALAQFLKHTGHDVSGSDREESPVVNMLIKKGIPVMVGHDAHNIPAHTELLIYSDAVYSDNPERMRAKGTGIPEMSYYEALGEVSRGRRTIAVTGTHGKTTTTGMLAAILQHCKKEPTAIIGSIIKDFGSNFLAGRSDIFVVEACEYRDHVLKLSPEILVITNIELDHTDYFPNLEALQETFKKAAERVPKHGVIVTMSNDSNIAPILQNVSARIVDFSKCGTYEVPHLIGEFNKMNACAAAAAAQAAFPDISQEAIAIALKNFKGSWRRFEYRGETPSGALVYDDYAHHPTAIRKTLEAAREKFPHKKIVVAFHPHLYSRTKSFLNEFAEALSLADHAIVAPIYAAREEPDPEISNHTVADAARSFGGNVEAMDSFDEIRDRLLLEDEGTLIITMGAGDIYKIAEQIAD
ncbi:MAG: UDP-N-acetylmuramate-L-alanine ligase [Candidatus Kaiserbacteria bacterium GW2011_GWA2_52_12]|uniref:UDP-N-acetylmuramate--L-alanine ligase n=1 Tax=Candidatus Kaiserbacteria bacterium GW2011_GWA2_52_12 TaxID=1618671 RepID=A0A0G1WZB3_9BACT|nr:MAG: UDP-N-acetylmuramate-L-alanine ligase [Candidatus Kaiserbacteria bacterium GW2011_GWA2_52_12]